MKKFSVKTIFAIGIGAALFFLLGRFVSIPSPVANTELGIQYGPLAFLAVVYGPIAGTLIGLIGHVLIDVSYGWGIWWSQVIASAVFGLLMGIASRILRLKRRTLGKEGLISFNISQMACHIVCWAGIAPGLEHLMYSEPLADLRAQGMASAAVNSLATAIVGSILCLGYAVTGKRHRKSSV